MLAPCPPDKYCVEGSDSFTIVSEMCGNINEWDFATYSYYENVDGTIIVEKNCPECAVLDKPVGIMIPTRLSEDVPVDCTYYDEWRDTSQPDDFETRARAFIGDMVDRGLELLMSDEDISSGPIFRPQQMLAQTDAAARPAKKIGY